MQKKNINPKTPFEKKVAKQLKQYFKNPKFRFDLPLILDGTEFQQKVWRALQKIPVGKTMTYGELAEKLESSPRAIGNACRANPIPLIIPCHRIVSKTGLGGFSGKTKGKTIAVKEWLLNHEATENIVLPRRTRRTQRN